MADNISGIIEVLRLTQEYAVRDVGKKAVTSSGAISKELNELATDMFATRQAAEACMRLLAKYIDHRYGTLNWVTSSVPPALTPQWWKQYGSKAIKSFITKEFNQAYRVMKDDEWQKAVRRVAAGLHSMAADARELEFLVKAREKYNTILEDAEKVLQRLDYGVLESMSRYAELVAKETENQNIDKFSQFLHSAYYQLVNLVQRIDVERRVNVKFIRPRALPKSASNQAELNAKTILQNSAKIPIEDRRIWFTLNTAILALFNNSKVDISKLPDMWRAVKPKFEELAKQTGSVPKAPKEEIDQHKRESVYQALQVLNKLLYTLNGLKLGEFAQYLKQKKKDLEPLRTEVAINWIVEGAEALKAFDEAARRIGKQYGAKYAVRFAVTKKYADLEPFKSFPEIIATAQKNYLSSGWLTKVYIKIADSKREIVGHIPELEPEMTKLANAILHAQDGFKSLFNKIHYAEKHPNLFVKIEEKKQTNKKPAREKRKLEEVTGGVGGVNENHTKIKSAFAEVDKFLGKLDKMQLEALANLLVSRKSQLRKLEVQKSIEKLAGAAGEIREFRLKLATLKSKYEVEEHVKFSKVVTIDVTSLEPFKTMKDILRVSEALSWEAFFRVTSECTKLMHDVAAIVPELKELLVKLTGALGNARSGFLDLFNAMQKAANNPERFVDKSPMRDAPTNYLKTLQELRNMPVEIYIKNLRKLEDDLTNFSRQSQYLGPTLHKSLQLPKLRDFVSSSLAKFTKIKEQLDKYFTSGIAFSAYSESKARDALNRHSQAVSSLDAVLGTTLTPTNFSSFIRRFDNLCAKLPKEAKLDSGDLKFQMAEVFKQLKILRTVRAKIAETQVIGRTEVKPDDYVEKASKEMDAGMRLLNAVIKFSTYSRLSEIENIVRQIDSGRNQKLHSASVKFMNAVRDFQSIYAVFRREVVEKIRILTSESAKKIPKSRWKREWTARKSFSISFSDDLRRKILEAGRKTKFATKKYWTEFVLEIKRCYRQLPTIYHSRQLQQLEFCANRVIETWGELSAIAKTP